MQSQRWEVPNFKISLGVVEVLLQAILQLFQKVCSIESLRAFFEIWDGVFMPVNVVDQNMFSKGNVERKFKLLNSNSLHACYFKILCHIISFIENKPFATNQMILTQFRVSALRPPSDSFQFQKPSPQG